MTIEKIIPTDWDRYYMGFADQAKTKSKDPSTQVGAVIINDDGHIVGTGFNGFPKGVTDCRERYENRSVKLMMVEHAERNAIFFAARAGTSTKGCTMYVSGLPPCAECARAVIQSGITRLVMRSAEIPDRWREACEMAILMLNESGVKLQTFPSTSIEDHDNYDPPEDEELAFTYHEGFSSRLCGKSATDNPYTMSGHERDTTYDDECHMYWEMGFDDAT